MIWIVFAVFCLSAWGQASNFAGEYRNEHMSLKLQATGEEYTGTIVSEGNSLPLTARVAGEGLAGKFQFSGREFAFAIKRDGAALVLTTDDVSHRLERVESKAANPLAKPMPAPAAKDQGLVGSWRTPTGVMTFNPDGSGTANGSAFRYQVEGNAVTMSSAEGSVKLNFRVDGNAMQLIGPGGQIALTRVTESASGAGGVQPDLAGKWCYVSNVYATGGGARSSNSCLTLHPDGRYEYSGATDSYGPAGGATSQSSDRGTWTATETSLTGKSVSGRIITYALEKRNHPKNKDPMLVLDGKAFVTFYQKAPW